jgi:hypothetical protein
VGIDGLFEPSDDADLPESQAEVSGTDEPADHCQSNGPSEGRSRQEHYETLESAQASRGEDFKSMLAARPAIERPEWQAPLGQGAVERCGPGLIDERLKEFSPAERRIAEFLAGYGPAVVAVAEGFGASGRTPDARFNGVPVEFKSLDPGASDRTVKAALNRAKGQARHAVVDARDSGLAEDDAQHGIRRFCGTPHGDRIDAILILGDNFTIDWKRAD